jgi:hypothetical protein
MTTEIKARKTFHRDTAGLRDVMMDEIERLINGETDYKTVGAMARLNSTIFDSIYLEMELTKFQERTPKKMEQPAIAGKITSIPLGR